MPFPEPPRVICDENPLNDEVRDCVSKAERLVKTLPAGDLKHNAKKFLSSLRKVLSLELQPGVDVGMLPLLEATCPDDHTLSSSGRMKITGLVSASNRIRENRVSI